MKKILITDVPAESGGALTILLKYYDEAKKDNSNKWLFITSVVTLEETSNIQNLTFPWIKKSWIHRLFFDYFIQPQVVKKNNIDEIISLDNTTVKFNSLPQTVYIHQSLPFTDIKFSFSDNKKFWIYQNLIGKRIISSIKKSKKVIVQTKWLKEAIVASTGVNSNKISVIPPNFDFSNLNSYKDTKKSRHTFFYPASSNVYKNHKIIVDAALKLKNENIDNYTIIFTIDGTESEHSKKLFEISNKNKLPIKFMGAIKYNDVLKMYSESVLIFPSYIETFGLPLLEASRIGAPILASDMPFSHEILNDYDKVSFFPYDDSDRLVKLMRDNFLLK